MAYLWWCIYGVSLLVDAEDQPLTVHTDMVLVARAMCQFNTVVYGVSMVVYLWCVSVGRW